MFSLKLVTHTTGASLTDGARCPIINAYNYLMITYLIH